MLKMAVGHSDDVDPLDAIGAAIEQCRAGLAGMTPKAAILYAAFDSFQPGVMAAVGEAFPGMPVVGATSAAELTSVEGFQEDLDRPRRVRLGQRGHHGGHRDGLGGRFKGACRAATAQALAGTSLQPRLCVVLTEAFVVDPQATLDAIAGALPPGVTLVGGASSRSGFAALTPTYQICDATVADDGVALLLFSGPLNSSVAIGTGWKGIGPIGTVTRGRRGAIEEIDGRPALEFVSPYLGTTGAAALGNPIAILESGADEPYLRASLRSDWRSARWRSWAPYRWAHRCSSPPPTPGDDRRHPGRAAQRRRSLSGGREPGGGADLLVRRAPLAARLPYAARDRAGALRAGASVPFSGLYCNGEVGPRRKAPPTAASSTRPS